jgi:hypothetical protein
VAILTDGEMPLEALERFVAGQRELRVIGSSGWDGQRTGQDLLPDLRQRLGEDAHGGVIAGRRY